MILRLGLVLLFSMVFAAGEVVEYGNKKCPISGEEIVEGEEFKYEYEGVNYNLCCKMCVKDFEKDPEKHIAELKEMKAGAEEHEHPHEHPY